MSLLFYVSKKVSHVTTEVIFVHVTRLRHVSVFGLYRFPFCLLVDRYRVFGEKKGMRECILGERVTNKTATSMVLQGRFTLVSNIRLPFLFGICSVLIVELLSEDHLYG